MAKETLSKKIQEALIKVGEKIIIDLGAELVLKNRITDATKSRLITEAEVRINGTMIEIWMPQYWEYVNYGTEPGNIPYNPGQRTGAGTSKYISALLNYLQTKGKNSADPRTKGIAFAIATKQSRYGNPIDRSKLGFLASAIQRDSNKWFTLLEQVMGEALEFVIFESIDEVEKQIKL